MPVHKKSKTFFYHVPKCAGSGIEEMFGMRTVPNLFLPEFGTVEFKGTKFSLQHLTPEAVDSLYPEFSDFESYAITRNPYEKAVASYCWLKTKRDKERFFRFRESRFIKCSTSLQSCSMLTTRFLNHSGRATLTIDLISVNMLLSLSN